MNIIRLEPLLKKTVVEIEIPGSKSYTNRSLILAYLTKSKVKIINPLISDDTEVMISCLKKLGVKVIKKDDFIEVENSISTVGNRLYDLNAGLSGTTIRFMLALSTIIPGIKTLYGKAGLNNRPIAELVDALRQLGAKIEYLEKEGFPPVRVSSSKLYPGIVYIKGSISSQYISALLIIAPLIGDIVIEVTGNQISKPYIDMTIDIIQKFGVKVINKNYQKYLINRQNYSAKKYSIEGDFSSAAYFFAIAALTKSTLILKNLNPKSKQADLEFVKILEKMGNKIIYKENKISIQGSGVKSINIDMTSCPDQVQTLAVLAAFAKGITKISGIQSLKIKETDRIFALRQELKKMGIKTSATKDILIIYGGSPKPARIETYNDHRMAMSFAVAAGKLSGMEIINPEVVNKTFPDFWEKLSSVGIKNKIVSDKNIVLIGMRGSGKTTIAKLLAKKLSKQSVELDKLIAEKVGVSIQTIVKTHGWNFFRNKESEIAKDVSLKNNMVISTGGGVILKQENIDALKKNGIFILLNASVETLLKRIGNYSKFPSLTNKKTPKEELILVLKQRKHLYQKAADAIINTDNLNPKQVVNLIMSKIGSYI